MCRTCAWRDRLVLLLCWAAVLFMAAYYWAAPIPGSVAETELGLHIPHAREPVTARSLPVICVTALPFALLTLNTFARGRDLMAKALCAYQRRSLLAVLLVTLATLLGLPLFRPGPLPPAHELAVCAVGALIVLWLFYRRETVNERLVILAGSWLLTLILSRQTLLLFPGRVDLLSASWRTWAIFGVHAGSYALATVMPLFVTLPRVRSTLARVLRIPSRLLLWPPMLLLLCIFASWLLIETRSSESFRLVLILRTGLLLLTAYVPVLLGATQEPHALRNPPREADVPQWIAGILMAVCGSLFLVLSAIITSNRLESLNPDGIAYIGIARSYSSGHPVVRGAWSPLISWILAPAMIADPDGRLAFRIVLVLSGLATMAATYLLASQLGLPRYVRALASTAVGLIILANRGLAQLTPDLLGAAVLSFYFWSIARPGFGHRPWTRGVTSGLLAGLSYYAKYYNLVFIPPHLLLTGAFSVAASSEKRSRLAALSIALSVYFLLIAPWVVALSIRYGYPTFTTSARISRAFLVARKNFCWNVHPCPRPDDVLVPIEDPLPEYYAYADASASDSASRLRYQVILTRENIWAWSYMLIERLGPLPPLALIATLFAAVAGRPHAQQPLEGPYFASCALLYAAGYMLTYASDFRYYFAIIPLLVVTTFATLRQVARGLTNVDADPLLAKALGVTMLVLPLFTLVNWETLRGELTMKPSPCLRADALAMGTYLEAPIVGADRQVNYVAFFTRTRTYGVLPSQTPPAEADAQLREFGVRTYLAPKGSPLAAELTSRFGYTLLASASMCGTDYEILRVPQ